MWKGTRKNMRTRERLNVSCWIELTGSPDSECLARFHLCCTSFLHSLILPLGLSPAFWLVPPHVVHFYHSGGPSKQHVTAELAQQEKKYDGQGHAFAEAALYTRYLHRSSRLVFSFVSTIWSRRELMLISIFSPFKNHPWVWQRCPRQASTFR